MSGPRDIGRAAITLAAVGLLSVVLLAVIHLMTREPIHQAELKAERDALAVVLPTDRYDNEPLDDEISVVAPLWLSDEEPLIVMRARRDGAPAALVVHSVAPRNERPVQQARRRVARALRSAAPRRSAIAVQQR